MRYSTLVPDTSQLQLMYTTAKINADRYNYTLKTKAIEVQNTADLDSFNILTVNTNTEKILLANLTDAPISKFKVNSDLPFLKKSGLPDLKYSSIFTQVNGYLYLYNHLYINSVSLVSDMAHTILGASDYLSLADNKSTISHIRFKKYLETLMYFYSKCTDKDSLIPYTFYLLTQYNTYSLADLESQNHFYEHAAKNKYVLPDLGILKNVIILNETKNIKREESGGWVLEELNEKNIDMCRMGFYQTLVYGFELLYQFNKLTHIEYKNALEELFIAHLPKEETLFTKYLYNKNPENNESIQIVTALLNCFNEDPSIRFEKYASYLKVICEDPQIQDIDVILTQPELYQVPLYFSKLINSMHHYAVQKYRINYITFLYSLAKERNLLDKIIESIALQSENPDAMPLPESDFENNTSSSKDISLLPELQKAYDKLNTSKPDAKEDVSDIKLDDIESLKEHSSKYNYTINYVESANADVDAYYKIANNVKLITHNLSKQIKEIKVYNVGGKNAGLSTGKLDRKNLYKYKSDPKIFYNNSYKIKEMDLAFGCILDESGSMHGEKIINGRIAMIMLHEVLSSLSINHSIIGHTSDGHHHCEINKYFQFQEEKKHSVAKPYAVANIQAKWGNCDSGALYYMEKCLNKVKNKDKIVLIFSDGEPTECTDMELKQQVSSMEAKGIHVIGIGINFNKIVQYYPDNANGKNLTEMVNIIVNILKRYVLEKED